MTPPPRPSQTVEVDVELDVLRIAGVDAALRTDDEIDQLRSALRGALGTAKDGGPPVPRDDWRSSWTALAGLGVTGFCVPAAKGGFGLRVDAAVATAMELGAALHGAPFAGLTASAYALGRTADDPVADELVAGILTGESVCAFGQLGAGGDVARLVDGAAEADALLLLGPSAESLTLLLDRDRDRWSYQASRHGLDVSRTCGDVAVDRERGDRIRGDGQVRELFGLLLAADAVGCVQGVLDRAVAYAGQRQAFGRPIGGFQAVQHRLVDHAVRVRGLALAVFEAARLLADDAPQARRAVALAELSVSSAATHIVHDLLQLTGAIAFTWEYGLHFYERRVHHDARLASNPRAAARSLAELEGWRHAH